MAAIGRRPRSREWPTRPAEAANRRRAGCPGRPCAARGTGRNASLGGLNQEPAGAGERHLDRLPGRSSDEGLQVHVGLDRGREPARPGDRCLRVGERLLAVDLDQHRRAVGDEGEPPRAGQLHVVEAAGQRARGALDPLDVPVDAGIEGEHVGAVGGDPVVLELQQLDLLRHVGQEHLAAARDLHQVRALAGDRLLDHPRDPAGARMLEPDLALVGDHRAQLGLDRHVGQLDLEQLRVLEPERLASLGLLELRQRLLYRTSRLPWLGFLLTRFRTDDGRCRARTSGFEGRLLSRALEPTIAHRDGADRRTSSAYKRLGELDPVHGRSRRNPSGPCSPLRRDAAEATISSLSGRGPAEPPPSKSRPHEPHVSPRSPRHEPRLQGFMV